VGRFSVVTLTAAFAIAIAPVANARTDDGGRQIHLRWPVNGTLTSPFGWDGGRPHAGLDIGMLRSLDVTAAEAGVVTRVGTLAGYDGYGIIVEVQLNKRYSTLYAHLSRTLVDVGDVLVPYQKLGIAGCTGSCTGTHLHFELRDRGRPVDPTLLISR
jgi:murein DD-endopeptidase MepM/ murein hydrolase activator NlpD